jgi:FAD/FMN-containing dehydrogenase
MPRAGLGSTMRRMLTTRTLDPHRLDVLRAALPHGNVLAPGQPGWDAARRGYDTAADLRPAGVVEACSLADIQTAMMFARAQELGIAPHSSGHGAAALAPLDDALLLRTSALTGAEIDAEARTARVHPGTTWGELAAAAGTHGLAGLAGTHDSVGVIGQTLGGGLGRLGRRYGLACNSVHAIELLTADGRLVRADAQHEAELFWALRGGAVGAGIVTALELDLFPVRDVSAGMLIYGAERAGEVLRAWRTWAADAPRELSTTALIVVLPPLRAVPEPLRLRRAVVIEATHLDGEVAAAPLVAPLRALAPAADTMATLPAAALGALYGEDNATPGAKAHEHAMLRALPDAAIDALVGLAGADSPLVFVELRRLGGALAEPGPGALAALDGEFSLQAAGLRSRATDARLAMLAGALRRWTGRPFLNFAHRPPARAFEPAVQERLARVQARYDPSGLIRVRHGSQRVTSRPTPRSRARRWARSAATMSSTTWPIDL